MRFEIALCVIKVVAMATVIQEPPNKYEGFKKLLCLYWYNWPWVLKVERMKPIERLPQIRTLVGNCEVDVGTCPIGSCSIFCPDDGYICPETETRMKDCGVFGSRPYEYVKQCGCCKDNGIVVIGVVKDQVSQQPVDRIFVFLDLNTLITGKDGIFKTTIGSSVRRIVIRTNKQDYLEAVKVVDIPEGFRGPVQIEIFVIMKSDPVKIDSTESTVLSLSSNPLDPKAGSTLVEIQAKSFIYSNEKPYQGIVKASITFLDTGNNPDIEVPGLFQTTIGNTVEPLITDGVFSFNFESADGIEIKLSAPVKFTVQAGMKVWKLNSFTGLWELVRPAVKRRKRQVLLEDIINIESDRWYNIDKIPGAPRCYFKGRIFDKMSGTEITSSSTVSFRPEITAYTSAKERLRLYFKYTTKPSTTCYEVRCPLVSNPDKNLSGFINMSSTEVVSIGGTNVPIVTYLTPRELADYDDANIEPKLSDVLYKIAPNSLDTFVNFVSDTEGPFYSNKTICESSSIKQPALHFFKPDLPSYDPVPDDAKICTARIAFRGHYNFSSNISKITNLPNVTGISVWEQDGSKFYYTDVAQMELLTNGNYTFVFICLKYRCSQENELTTVYIVAKEVQVPLTDGEQFIDFRCYGKQNVSAELNVRDDKYSTITGSFTAPVNVGTGPDFYNTDVNDCKQETNPAVFAYELYCRMLLVA